MERRLLLRRRWTLLRHHRRGVLRLLSLSLGCDHSRLVLLGWRVWCNDCRLQGQLLVLLHTLRVRRESRAPQATHPLAASWLLALSLMALLHPLGWGYN